MRMRVSGSLLSGQALPQALDDGVEGVLLDEVQQLLFRFEVVVKARQRDAAQARQIAHGSALVSFLGKDFGGIVENLAQAAVEAGIGAGKDVLGPGLWRKRTWFMVWPKRKPGTGRFSNVRSNSISILATAAAAIDPQHRSASRIWMPASDCCPARQTLALTSVPRTGKLLHPEDSVPSGLERALTRPQRAH